MPGLASEYLKYRMFLQVACPGGGCSMGRSLNRDYGPLRSLGVIGTYGYSVINY